MEIVKRLDVDCGEVSGSVTTISGDVECGNIAGSATTISGDISKTIGL